ncbi:MAG: hypothetical protein KIT36_10480 [Alphaproteobacteria bacterium]|nr:hypothetical protein [Alphaproteobacteria bacterium]
MTGNVITLSRHRRAAPETPPAAAVVVRVHGWKHVAAALLAARDARRRVTLLAPPGGTYTGGVGFWAAIDRRRLELFADVDAELVVDCDGAPGHVLAALRVGLKRLVFDGNAPARKRLTDIAAGYGATLVGRPVAAIDLIHEKDPARACRLLFTPG